MVNLNKSEITVLFYLNCHKTWALQNNIRLEFLKHDSPYQNVFVERFYRSYREEVLDLYLFESLQEVREITDEYLNIYKYERLHEIT